MLRVGWMQLQPQRFHLFICRTVLHLLSLESSPFSLGQQNSKHYKGAVQGVRCNSLEYSCNKEFARLVMEVPGAAIACICFCVNMMSHS